MSDKNKYKGSLVVMANIVIKARHNLNLQEKRLVNMAISQAHGENCEIRISATDFAKEFKLSPDNAFRDLKRIQTSLKTKTIDFPVQDEDGLAMASIPWLRRSMYSNGNGYIKLLFSEEIAPHLFNQKKNFTAYSLQKGVAFKRISSWRLLEQFERNSGHKKDHEGFNTWSVKIYELHEILEATKTYREQFGQFKRRAIDPAIKELQDKGNWLIFWKPHRIGRRVMSVEFKFKQK